MEEKPFARPSARGWAYHAAWIPLIVWCIAMNGCTTVNYSPQKPSSYPAYQGKLILLSNERGKENVPRAEELGVVTVTTSWPWLSKAEHVRLWKKEAAKHGANAVRWYGESGGRSGFKTTIRSFAKIYRIQDIDNPQLRNYLARPYDYYHE